MMSTTHLHITTWVIGIILFFVAYSLLKKGSPKAKMTAYDYTFVLHFDFSNRRYVNFKF